MKKRLFIIIPLLLAAGFLLWRFVHKSGFLYAGTVEATEIDISPRVSSLIASYDVKEGETVNQNQVLVRLACEDIKISAELAERDFKRAQNLYKEGSMPDEAFDQRRFKAEDTRLKMDWCTITAPSSGTILNTYHEAGEMVSPGMKLLTLGDLSEVWAIIYVPQPLLAKISLNQTVQARLPELGMKRYAGRVSHINSEAEFTPKNVQTREERTRLVYGVKVSFQNTDGVLKPGMTVEVELPD